MLSIILLGLTSKWKKHLHHLKRFVLSTSMRRKENSSLKIAADMGQADTYKSVDVVGFV